MISRLAIASVAAGAVGVLGACVGGGVIGFLAILCGTMALERVRKAPLQLQGRAFAWTGISLGSIAVILTLLLAWLQGSMQTRWSSQLDAGLRTTFAAVDAAGAKAAIDDWMAVSGSTLSEAQIFEFAQEVSKRYGAFQSFEELARDTNASWTGSNHLHVTAAFEFAKGRSLGSLDFRLVPSPSDLVPTVRLERLTIVDPTNGDLSLPRKELNTNEGEPETKGVAP